MASAPSIGRSGAIVASGTLVSRLLGFVNALLLYNTIGTVGQGADAFALANQLPNNIYLILAGGTITAIIVPAIVRATGHEDGGERFLNRLVTLGLTIFLVVAAAITVAAPLLLHLYAQSGEQGFAPAQFELALAFAYWTLPQILFYGVFAILSEVLNARRVFWPYAWAPVVNNLVLTAVLIAFRLAFGSVAGDEASEWGPGRIALLAGGATLGIAVQAAVLVLAWRRAGIRFRPDFRWRGTGFGRFGRLAAWTFAGTLVAQAGGVVESNVVSLATGSASIATLTLTRLIFTLPWSLITLSIAVPYFTRMSEHAKQEDRASLGADLTRATASVTLLIVLAGGAIAVLAPWVGALFGADDPAAFAIVLQIYLLGLVPTSVQSILMRGWYAMHDTRTPTLFYFAQVVVYVVLLLSWVAHSPLEDIARNAAGAMAIAFGVNALLCIIVMRRTLPSFRLGWYLGRLGWYLGAMVPTALVGIGAIRLLHPGAGPGPAIGSWLDALLTCLGGGILMLLVYLGVLALTRNPELRAVTAALRARLGRRAE